MRHSTYSCGYGDLPSTEKDSKNSYPLDFGRAHDPRYPHPCTLVAPTPNSLKFCGFYPCTLVAPRLTEQMSPLDFGRASPWTLVAPIGSFPLIYQVKIVLASSN